ILLSYRYINTEYRSTGFVKFFLVNDGIDTNRCLSSLAVTNDQLTLSTTYRDHGIDCFDTGLKWFSYRFPENNTWRLTLDGHFKGFTSNRTFSVDWLAEGIHYTTQHAFAYRNRSDFIGTTDGIAFSDCIGWTQCY